MSETSETAEDITNKVTSKEADDKPVFDRMDNDYKMWDLQSNYGILNDVTNVSSVPKSRDSDVNIVSNKPRTFSDQVQSTLSDAEMQIMVRMVEKEGEDLRDDIANLERLFHFALEMTDRRLRKMLLPTFKESSIWYSLVRGWLVGSVVIFKKNNGDVIFDIRSLDRRWLTYGIGADGINWSSYKTFMSGASLKDEWDYGDGKEKDNAVIDHWKHEADGRFRNSVIVDNKFLKKPTVHKLRSFPLIIVPVATRPPVVAPESTTNTKTSEVAGYGESIFAPLRSINKIRNNFASIAATHANLLAKQPMINYYGAKGQKLKTTAYLAEMVLNLPRGENELRPAPMAELSPTVVNLLNFLSAEVEEATLPIIPIGSPAPSGTLYNLVQEAGNKIFNPQLKNQVYFYEEICRQVEEQLIDGNITVDVKHEEKKKYYEVKVKPVDLKKPHFIKVEITARTPWTQFDTYQIADMAKRLGLPDAFIHEFILKLPDPKEIADMSAVELALHSPNLAMVTAIEALMLKGRVDEAEQVMRDWAKLAQQEEMAIEAQVVDTKATETPAPPPPPEEGI